MKTAYAYFCECGCKYVVGTYDYEYLFDLVMDDDGSPGFNFEELRDKHYIIYKTHIHHIPKALKIISSAGELFLVKES
jgi:hypothetical protein